MAVVTTLTVAVAGDPLGVTEDGDTVQLDPAGAPVQVSMTTWLNPPRGVMVRFEVAVWPATIGEGEKGDAEIEKSIPVPVPVSGIICGLPEPLSVMVRVPDCKPAAVGAKVTLILQLAVTAPTQLLVSA
jgi:hypothetical protein